MPEARVSEIALFFPGLGPFEDQKLKIGQQTGTNLTLTFFTLSLPAVQNNGDRAGTAVSWPEFRFDLLADATPVLSHSCKADARERSFVPQSRKPVKLAHLPGSIQHSCPERLGNVSSACHHQDHLHQHHKHHKQHHHRYLH